VSLNIITNSLTSSEHTIMTSNTTFKAALIVVDLQEDFCPPVSPSPAIQSRSDPRGVTQAHKKTSCTETILKPRFHSLKPHHVLTSSTEWQFSRD
jgi:nicotinamidase-related amidase